MATHIEKKRATNLMMREKYIFVGIVTGSEGLTTGGHFFREETCPVELLYPFLSCQLFIPIPGAGFYFFFVDCFVNFCVIAALPSSNILFVDPAMLQSAPNSKNVAILLKLFILINTLKDNEVGFEIKTICAALKKINCFLQTAFLLSSTIRRGLT